MTLSAWLLGPYSWTDSLSLSGPMKQQCHPLTLSHSKTGKRRVSHLECRHATKEDGSHLPDKLALARAQNTNVVAPISKDHQHIHPYPWDAGAHTTSHITILDVRLRVFCLHRGPLCVGRLGGYPTEKWNAEVTFRDAAEQSQDVVTDGF